MKKILGFCLVLLVLGTAIGFSQWPITTIRFRATLMLLRGENVLQHINGDIVWNDLQGGSAIAQMLINYRDGSSTRIMFSNRRVQENNPNMRIYDVVLSDHIGNSTRTTGYAYWEGRTITSLYIVEPSDGVSVMIELRLQEIR